MISPEGHGPILARDGIIERSKTGERIVRTGRGGNGIGQQAKRGRGNDKKSSQQISHAFLSDY